MSRGAERELSQIPPRKELEHVLKEIDALRASDTHDPDDLRKLYSKYLSAVHHYREELEDLIGFRRADTRIPGWGKQQNP